MSKIVNPGLVDDIRQPTDKEKFQIQLRQMLEKPDFDEQELIDAINAYRDSMESPFYRHTDPVTGFVAANEAQLEANNKAVNEAIRETLQQYAEDKGYSISMDENGIGGINAENIDDFLRDCDRTDFVNCGKNASEAAEERERYGKPLSDEEFRQKIKDALSDPDFDREAFDAMIKEQEQRLIEKAQLDAKNGTDKLLPFADAWKQAEDKAANAVYNYPVDGINDSVPLMTSGNPDADYAASARDDINKNIQAALKEYAVENNIPYSTGEAGITSITADNIGDFIERGSRDDFTKCTPIPAAWHEWTVEDEPVPGGDSPEETAPGASPDDGQTGKMQTLWESVTSNPTVKAIADKIKEIGGKIKEWAQNKLVVDKDSVDKPVPSKQEQAAAVLGDFGEDTSLDTVNYVER